MEQYLVLFYSPLPFFISSNFPHPFFSQGQRNQVDKEVGYHSPLVAIQVDESTSFFLVSFLILFRLFVSIPSPSLNQLVLCRWTPPPRASWCTWSAAPTTAASSTTRRTSLVSFSSKSKSCKERSSAQLQIQLWQTSSSVIGAFETRL